MAINQNHTFDELDGIKCCIVEKNATPERVDFLKKLLESNKYTVVVIPTPPPKTAAPVAETDTPALPPVPATFTVGVTDLTFNPVNAIWGRLLINPDGSIVTLADWQQNKIITDIL